ncbi:hypothetical protein PAXINDRAFT_182411 [Paxillus involutus ATCC 200175]|uniref:DUF7918 domain-containing protein n=1 Tax=Paxillus involutus ATCC 200175 TaxID=664439 RepID=A0A0C9T9E7_PAXIN|nr:hypothetical protein PAXINDRAFT_182411 [Paxillus involutus ATCC 200175]
MQLGDFSAHVVVDGKELEEYDVVIDSSTKATCYIASEQGKTFSVKWQCHAEIRLTDNSGKVMVDGISCGAYMMRSGSLGDEDTRVLSHIGETKARDLMFSRLQLSDDDDLLDKEVPKDLGDISLNIKRGELVKSRRRNRKTESCAPDENLKFHEKSKKATVHCVSFGPERVLRQQTTPSKFRVRVVPNDDPLLVFVFKYRPLGILQANGIAPKPVSVSSGSRHNVNLDECEIEIQDGSYIEDIKPVELDGRIETLENELKRLRSLQAGASQDRKPKRVKKEEPGLEKRLRFTPGEVIDLT